MGYMHLSASKMRITGAGKIRLAAAIPGAGQSPLTLTLIDFYTSHAGIQPIVQRTSGAITGKVPLLFTYSGSAPTNIEARVMQGATVVKNWTAISGPIVVGGSGSGYLAGVTQGTGYTIQIRDGLQPANSATISNGSVPFGIGCIFAFEGQSNAVGTLTADYNYTVPVAGVSEYTNYNNGAVSGSIFDDAGWHAPSNGSNGVTGSIGNTATGGIIMFMRLITNRLKVFYGYDVPVGIIPWAFGSTGIASFVPGGARYNTLFNNSGSATNIGFSSAKNIWPGDIEGVLWHQGEADQAVSASAYQASLQTLYNGYLSYVATFGRTASNFLFAPAVLGNYSTSNCPSIENIRTAVANFEAVNAIASARIGWTTIDLSTSAGAGAGLHFVLASDQRRSLKRAVQTCMKFLGIAAFSGRGATINTMPSRSGLMVTLSVVHEGGTALALPTPANPPTGFYANTLADFSGTDISLTASLINGNTQIQLTFPGGTSFPLYIKYLGGKIGSTVVDGNGFTASCNPDFTNCIYDNVSYPTGATGTDIEAMGLPLLPTVGAIMVM